MFNISQKGSAMATRWQTYVDIKFLFPPVAPMPLGEGIRPLWSSGEICHQRKKIPWLEGLTNIILHIFYIMQMLTKKILKH